MESEQRMKLIEDIRKELSRGNYQMDKDDLPYSGTAERVGNMLWEKGWRPEEAESSLFQTYLDKYNAVWATLFGIRGTIEHLIKTGVPNDAWLKGLDVAWHVVDDRMTEVKRSMDYWEQEQNKALEKEGYSE